MVKTAFKMEIGMRHFTAGRTQSVHSVVTLSLMLCALCLPAQQRRILGVYDTDIPAPTFAGPVGAKDQAALAALKNYLKTTNTGSYQDITLDGNILTDTSAGSVIEHATLVLEPVRRFRFDIQGQTGAVSTRIDGMAGALHRENAQVQLIPTETAFAGILISPWMLLDALDNPQVTVRDSGTASIQGQPLHKVTISRTPCLSSVCPNYLKRVQLNTDLYFDTRSGLLIKSVDDIRLSEASPAMALRVISYGGYKQVSQSLVPFEYSETIGGQRSWVFVVSTADFADPHDASFFTF